MVASGALKIGSRALASVRTLTAEASPTVESILQTAKSKFIDELCTEARPVMQATKSLGTRTDSAIIEPTPSVSHYLDYFKDGLEKLVRNLADGIKTRQWTSFIADDVSGRIPGNLIHAVARHHAADTGTRAPQLYYMASGLGGLTKIPKDLGGVNFEHLNGRALSERVLANKSQLEEGRALLITETIYNGGSVARIADALVEHGIKFDVASSGALEKRVIESVKSNHDSLRQGVRFFDGDAFLYTGGAGSRHATRLATGIEKYGAEATARVTRFDQDLVSSLRRETNALGTELYRKVFSNSV